MSQIPPVILMDGATLSFSSDSSPISQTSTEESNQVSLISSSIRSSTQQNHFPSTNCNTSSNLSGTVDSIKDKSSDSQTAAGCLPDGDSFRPTMVLVTSPSYNDDLSNEQSNYLLNESTDKVNLSSLLFLQTKQRRINHRRNKSEPFKCGSIEDLSSVDSLPTTNLESSSTSTTSNESAISSNASTENKRKSTQKTLSNNISPSNQINGFSQIQDKNSSSAPTKKRKSWYNVSFSK